ncbi:MAG: hypothetical protein H7A23_14965 [Leptospiraceae bacterium]|nr:hypothetical protein [Leptospiraceae bacterium]MCP5495852.1 hypothetical protein [Leptospiraceae bacterium]
MNNKKSILILSIIFSCILFSISIRSQENKTPTQESNAVDQKKKIDSHIQSGEYEKAITLLNKVIKEEPDYVVGHNQLGYCNMMLNKPDEALEHYQKSDSISPNLDAKAGTQWALLVKGNTKDSLKAGEEALKMDPNNYWVKERIKLAQKGGIYPVYSITPLYSGYEFKKSSFKGVGYKAGLNVAATFNSRWSASLGYYQSHTNTLVPKYGYIIYMRDSSNYQYFQYFQTTQAYINYFTTNTNLQQFAQVASTKDYDMKDYTLGTSYSPSGKASYWVSLHSISSNDSYTKGAYSANIGGTWGTKNKFTASVGGISFPKHKGGQASLSYAWNVWKGLWSDTMVMGQAIGIQKTSTEIYSVTNFFNTYYFTTYSNTETVSKSYGAIKQTFTYAFKWLSIGGGGRGGNAGYNPIFGNNLIYSPTLLKTGLFGFVNIYYFSRVNFNVSYAYDKWRNSEGESPYSRTWSFSLTARF